MSSNKFQKQNSTAYRALFSLLIFSGMLIAICLVTSVAAYCTADPMALVKPLSIAALILSAVASSVISAKKFGIATTLISALVLTIVMLSVGVIASGGKMNGGAMLNYLCYMATAALCSYLTTRAPKRRPKRHRR